MATISDIATRAGVSPMTVSRVLNGAEYNRPTFRERAERIRAIAEELGYKPNTSARAIRKGRFDAITLLLSTNYSASYVPPDMLLAIHNQLAQHGMTLNLSQLPDEQLMQSDALPRLLREKSSDGLIIDYTHSIPDQITQVIREGDVPWVWLNVKRERNVIRPDDFGAGRMATEHLLELGHRRIAYRRQHRLTDESHYSSQDRYEGFITAMKDAGLEPIEVAPSDPDHHPDAREFLDLPEPPTAIIAYSPTAAGNIMIACAERGLKCPQDLSVVTFASMPTSMVRDFQTLKVPERAMGEQAVDMLINRIETGEHQSPCILPFEWEQGNTTAPPQEA